jgi:hypothetical protein
LQLLPYTKILILSNYTEKCFFDNQIDDTLVDFISKCSNKSELEKKIRGLFEIHSVEI